MSILILVRFPYTSILFIVIALLLIKREPRKHINIDRKAKLICVLTEDVTVGFGKSILIANNSLSLETRDLHPKPIAPCIVKKSGVKLACYTSKIPFLWRYFFPCSFIAKHCLRLLDCYREPLGSNTLTSKNAF